MAFPTFLTSALIEFFGHNLPSRPPSSQKGGRRWGPKPRTV